MKTAPDFLVISERRGKPRVVRAMQNWPALDPGEAFIRVTFELPDDYLLAPIHTVEIDAEEITVGVEVEVPA